MMLRPLFFTTIILMAGCAGKSLDLGESGPPSKLTSLADGSATPADLTPLVGVWVMVRQDDQVGVPDSAAVPPMELDISTDGVVYLSTCARAVGEVATAPCPSSATSSCEEGTATRVAVQFHLSLPHPVEPNQGDARITTDGLLMVDYVHPSYSEGYFRRLDGTGLVGGCRN